MGRKEKGRNEGRKNGREGRKRGKREREKDSGLVALQLLSIMFSLRSAIALDFHIRK